MGLNPRNLLLFLKREDDPRVELEELTLGDTTVSLTLWPSFLEVNLVGPEGRAWAKIPMVEVLTAVETVTKERAQ